MKDNYVRPGEVIRVIDGDTVDIEVDLGFDIKTLVRFRLLGIDTPEIRGEEKEEGLKAKAALIQLFAGYNRKVTVFSRKYDGFKRALADIWVNDIHVNTWLLQNGFAEVYKR